MHTKRKKKKSLFLPILIVVTLLVFVVVQMYLINRNKIETVKAGEGYINDSIFSAGIICRDEKVLEDIADGYYYYNVENGDRVSSGMLVCNVYPKEEDIDLIYQSNNISTQIEKLEEAENFMSSVNVDISITRKQLGSEMAELSSLLCEKNYTDVYDKMSDIALNLNKINSAMNREGNISGTKDALKAQKDSIRAQISNPVQSIYSPSSGYFVNKIDGFEGRADVDRIKQLSYAEGMELIGSDSNDGNTNVYGKIITNYKWDLCTYITNEQAEKMYVGQKLRLSIDVGKDEYQSVIVEELIPKEDMTLLVLKSSTIDKTVVNSRVADCEILFSQYKGIKIPVEALRFVNGEQGVYVKFSKLVKFKKVKPIYQDEGYAILPLTPDKENQVEMYDDIIVKGVNLYDGKYL